MTDAREVVAHLLEDQFHTVYAPSVYREIADRILAALGELESDELTLVTYSSECLNRMVEARQERDALQRQIEALTSDKAVDAALMEYIDGFSPETPQAYLEAMRRAITAAIEASEGK